MMLAQLITFYDELSGSIPETYINISSGYCIIRRDGFDSTETILDVDKTNECIGWRTGLSHESSYEGARCSAPGYENMVMCRHYLRISERYIYQLSSVQGHELSRFACSDSDSEISSNRGDLFQ